MRNGEQRESFVGIESVFLRRPAVERVESEGFRQLARGLLEDVGEAQLSRGRAVQRDAFPWTLLDPDRADVRRNRRGDRPAQHGGVRAGALLLPVGGDDRLRDAVRARARERVLHPRALHERSSVAEVPDDAHSLGQILLRSVRHRNARGDGAVFARGRRDAPSASGAEEERRAGHSGEHGAPIYHTA